MPNFAALLKGELLRLSNRAARRQLAPLRSTSAAQRRHIAALRKQLIALEREVSILRRATATSLKQPPTPTEKFAGRFVAKGLVSLRAKLGLTAEEFGKL